MVAGARGWVYTRATIGVRRVRAHCASRYFVLTTRDRMSKVAALSFNFISGTIAALLEESSRGK